MNEWQPIETAPKDGQWITLWRPSVEKFYDRSPIVYGRWLDDSAAWSWPCQSEYDPWAREERANQLLNEDFYFCDLFTHWMPLPEPKL